MQILFEDEHLIALNKPSGIPSNTLESSSIDSPSMEELVARLYAPNPAFLLHRLDVGTSGVLLFAKSEDAFEKIRDLFRLKKIKKIYWAYSEEELKQELPLEITHSIAHHPKSKKRMVVIEPDKMAKRPQTFYRGNPIPAHSRILSSTPVEWLGKPLFRYEVEIITGVMHQIRVHCRFVGIPLIGDLIYGTKNEDPASSFPRLGLHAKKVEFKLGNYLYQIEAPGP
jgi:23S rRNA-/tRNA-specific pseudouridylate synthase